MWLMVAALLCSISRAQALLMSIEIVEILLSRLLSNVSLSLHRKWRLARVLFALLLLLLLVLASSSEKRTLLTALLEKREGDNVRVLEAVFRHDPKD